MKLLQPATGPGHPTRALVLALAAIATGAMADVVDIAWDASGRFERTQDVAPGKFAEVCGKLPAGLKVRWDFEAGTPLDFNVHYDVGKEVVYLFKPTALATAKETLATEIEQDYCWLWRNRSSAATTLKVRMQR